MLPDYFSILGVDIDASDFEIRFAFQKLEEKFHPERNGGDKFFEARYNNIKTAYFTLSDPRRKADYIARYFLLKQLLKN